MVAVETPIDVGNILCIFYDCLLGAFPKIVTLIRDLLKSLTIIKLRLEDTYAARHMKS